jgi:hypothetical protein
LRCRRPRFQLFFFHNFVCNRLRLRPSTSESSSRLLPSSLLDSRLVIPPNCAVAAPDFNCSFFIISFATGCACPGLRPVRCCPFCFGGCRLDESDLLAPARRIQSPTHALTPRVLLRLLKSTTPPEGSRIPGRTKAQTTTSSTNSTPCLHSLSPVLLSFAYTIISTSNSFLVRSRHCLLFLIAHNSLFTFHFLRLFFLLFPLAIFGLCDAILCLSTC